LTLSSSVSKKFEELSIAEKTVSRSRTSSETVDKKSDAVVENVVVTLSEPPQTAVAPSIVTQAAFAAPAPVKIHSVNSNNVKTSEVISQPSTVAASSPPAEGVTADSKTTSRATPPTGSIDYEPVSSETPKSNDEGNYFDFKSRQPWFVAGLRSQQIIFSLTGNCVMLR
jgi:hypothetical protein